LSFWTTPKSSSVPVREITLFHKARSNDQNLKQRLSKSTDAKRCHQSFFDPLFIPQFWDIFEGVKAVFGRPKFKNFFERDNHVNYTYLRTKIGCEMQICRAIRAISFTVSKKAAR